MTMPQENDPIRPRESANLDLLRATAVMAVFVTHLLATFGLSETGFGPRWDLGRIGVLLFFVHTSLVLMQSLERLRLEGRALVLSFAIRRIARIYPLSIAFVVLVTAFSIPTTPWRPGGFVWFGWGDLLSNLALTQNLTFSPSVIGPMWSLPYELQMYAILPFVFMLLRSRPSFALALGLWGASVVAALVQPDIAGRLDVARFGPCFMAGVIGYLGMKHYHARLPGWLWPVGLCASVAVFVAGPRWVTSWLFCLTVGLLIPHFREITSPWLRRVSAVVAKYSYGIYLSHTVAFWIAFRVFSDQPMAIQVLACVVFSALMPVASYHLLEEPCVRVGKRLADRWFHREVIRRPDLAPLPATGLIVARSSDASTPSSSARLIEITSPSRTSIDLTI